MCVTSAYALYIHPYVAVHPNRPAVLFCYFEDLWQAVAHPDQTIPRVKPAYVSIYSIDHFIPLGLFWPKPFQALPQAILYPNTKVTLFVPWDTVAVCYSKTILAGETQPRLYTPTGYNMPSPDTPVYITADDDFFQRVKTNSNHACPPAILIFFNIQTLHTSFAPALITSL